MNAVPQCGCSFSLSKDQIRKGTAVLFFLGTDLAQAVVLHKLFTETPFTFPLYAVALHALLSCILSAVILRTDVEGHMLPRIRPLATTWKNIVKILAQALNFALSVSLYNVSLSYIDMTLATMIKASVPIFTVLLSIIVRRQLRKPRIWIGVIGITIGMTAAIYRQPQFQLVGIILAGGSAVSDAFFIVLAEYIMIDNDLDPLNLLYYTSLPVTFFMLPSFLLLEVNAVVKYISHYFWTNIFIVFGTSILSFAVSVSRYHSIRLTSCVYASTIQNVRVVLLVVFSEIIYYSSDKKLKLINQAGIVLTLICFAYLTFVGFSEDSYKLPSYGNLAISNKLRRLMGRNRYEVIETDGMDVIAVDEADQRFTIEDDTEDIQPIYS